MADDYAPTLPEGMTLPAGMKVNTEHADYQALKAVAKEEGWSQKAFSKVLGLELQRQTRAAPKPAAAAPAPAPKAAVPERQALDAPAIRRIARHSLRARLTWPPSSTRSFIAVSPVASFRSR
jgi:hypothetical protein